MIAWLERILPESGALSGPIGYVLLVVAALVLIWALLRLSDRLRQSDSAVLALFGLNDGKWSCVAHDLGTAKGMSLRTRCLIGVPDGLFCHRQDRGRYLVGEYKGRRRRGRVRLREYYQVQLYAGMLLELRKAREVSCMLAYRDGVEHFPFDMRVYKALKQMIPETRNSLRGRRPSDLRPLAKRIPHVFE